VHGAAKAIVPRKLELVALAAGLGALALLCRRFGFAEIGVALRHVAPRYLVVYFALGIAVRFSYALRWWMVARALGVAPPLTRFVAARLAGDATGFLLPTGRISGDPLRAGLVYGEGVSGAQATAGVAIDRIMELISNMLCAVAYVMVFSLSRAGGAERPAAALIITMCVLLIALVLPLRMMRRGVRPFEPLYRLVARRGAGRWAAWIGALQRTEAHVIRFFRDHPAMFVQGLIGSLLIEGLIIGEYHFLLTAFGLALSLPTLLMTLLASGLSRAVPTPAGLGALEAGQVTVLAAAAGQPDVGFVVGLVLRLHETLWTGIGLIAMSRYARGWARLRSALSAGGAAS
jgi:uncharacterized protein (TIRG00374 family)